MDQKNEWSYYLKNHLQSSILSNTYLWTSKSIWRFMYKVLHCRVCITGMASSLSSLSLHENKHWGQILYKVVFAFLQILYRVVRQWWIIRKPLETSGNLRKFLKKCCENVDGHKKFDKESEPIVVSLVRICHSMKIFHVQSIFCSAESRQKSYEA